MPSHKNLHAVEIVTESLRLYGRITMLHKSFTGVERRSFVLNCQMFSNECLRVVEKILSLIQKEP